MSNSRLPSRKGFALPAVLAVTGVVTLIFLVAMTALASLVAEANSARARVRFLQRAMTAEAQLAYAAATEPMGNQGLSLGGARTVIDLSDSYDNPEMDSQSVDTLWMDGRPYRLELDLPLLVRVQDEAGMVNLANLAAPVHERLLQHLGVERGQQALLMARYDDYVDTDDQRRLNGAERADYSSSSPTNRRLIKPVEYLSILGVREALSARAWRQISPDLTANPLTAAINVNTASPAALSLLLGLSETQSQAVVARRQQAPVLTLFELDAITGQNFRNSFETILTYPAGSFVYTFHDSQSAWTYRGRIILSPTGLEQPLWIDQTELTEAPKRAAANLTDAPRLSLSPR